MFHRVTIIGFVGQDPQMRYTEDGSGRTTWLEKNSVTVYDAAANTVAEYSLRKHKDRLQAVALNEEAWGEYLANREQPMLPDSRLAFVRVVQDGVLAPEVLESKLSVKAGDPIDHRALAQNADRLYGLQYFEQVSYRLVEEADGIFVWCLEGLDRLYDNDRFTEPRIVREALDHYGGNLSATARALGIPRSTLRDRLRGVPEREL